PARSTHRVIGYRNDDGPHRADRLRHRPEPARSGARDAVAAVVPLSQASWRNYRGICSPHRGRLVHGMGVIAWDPLRVRHRASDNPEARHDGNWTRTIAD